MKIRTRTVARVIRPLSRLRACPSFSVLAYHRIDDGEGGMSVSPSAFVAHLDWLEERGSMWFHWRLSRWAGNRRMTRRIDVRRRVPSVADIAWPELRDRGLPATLYVVSQMLRGGRRFSWDTSTRAEDAALIGRSALLDLAADGLSIGSHTRTHVYLPSVRPQRVRDEVVGSRTDLEDELGQPVTSFSYPQGGWNPSIRSVVARAGYATAVTTDQDRTNRATTP